jgi:hypothetical protein
MNNYRIKNGLVPIEFKAFNSAKSFRKQAVDMFGITIE